MCVNSCALSRSFRHSENLSLWSNGRSGLVILFVHTELDFMHYCTIY